MRHAPLFIYVCICQVLTENGRLEVVGTAHTCAGVRRLVKSVVRGLRAWQEPEASAEGLGGTYFFMDERGAKTAIVKPCDEEPLAPNNPKVGQSHLLELQQLQQVQSFWLC